MQGPQADTLLVWLHGLLEQHRTHTAAVNRMSDTGPASFTGRVDETGFAGVQESRLIKWFCDCAPTVRENVQKILGSLSAHSELHYFDGGLSSLVAENNGLRE